MPAGTGLLTPKKKKSAPSTLGELRDQLTELDRLDDQISKRIVELEQALSKTLGLRVRVTTLIGSRFDLGDEFAEQLAFDKYVGTWRFVVESGEPGEPDSWDATPLLDCSRDVRAEALATHIPNLIEGAVQKLKERSEQRRVSLDRAEALLDNIRALAESGEGTE